MFLCVSRPLPVRLCRRLLFFFLKPNLITMSYWKLKQSNRAMCLHSKVLESGELLRCLSSGWGLKNYSPSRALSPGRDNSNTTDMSQPQDSD